MAERETLSPSTALVVDAMERAKEAIFLDDLVPWKQYPRNEEFEPSSNNSSKVFVSQITVKQTSEDPPTPARQSSTLDESYALQLSEQGILTIIAKTSAGALHGLNTLVQLFFKHSDGGVYTPFAPVNIVDKPHYPFRGLNLDVSRNWMPPSTIYRTIDALAWNKFNVLHLHATDAQSWPLEIPALPELAAKGAYRTGLSYSPADLAEMHDYARRRGVHIIVEIDMPGHTSSVAHAYPGLITAADKQPEWATYAAEPPSGQLKLNSSAVTTFVSTLLGDLLPRLSPYSAYFHTGGDEVNAAAYLLDETVRSSDPAVLRPLLQGFVDRAHDAVRSHGLTPIVWEEMLLDWNLTLAADVIVQTWRSDEAVKQVIERGHKALAGNYHYWVSAPLSSPDSLEVLQYKQYLDCGHGSFLLPPTAPNQLPQSTDFADYCGPYKPWPLIYSHPPTAGLAQGQSDDLVQGGEVHMWAELTDDTSLDDKVWPRAAAAGEVLWSGPLAQERNLQSVGSRLALWRERLVNRGIRAGVVQMTFCSQSQGSSCGLGS
ncbi:MAG: hypothetical protein M1825_001650 [Sarcosagium campestre]|nr:MAG: hypothetical protein M1825_001650 [Sarcosagium campestre]